MAGRRPSRPAPGYPLFVFSAPRRGVEFVSVDVTASLPADKDAAPPTRVGGEKIARLLGEIDALIADDEAADRRLEDVLGHPRGRARQYLGRVQRRSLDRRRELPSTGAPRAGGGEARL